MKKREADFGTYFRHWLKANPMISGAFELKQTTGKSIPFSDVQDHQIEALEAANSKHGILYKAPDDSRGVKPFDYFYLRNAPAWVVLKFPDAFHIISIGTFMQEKEAELKKPKGRKSITSVRSKEISVVTVSTRKKAT